MPKEPTPENKSKTFEFDKFTFNLFECLIILNIDSFVKSFKGLVLMSLGSEIFLPLNDPDIMRINLLLYTQYLFYKNHLSNLIYLNFLLYFSLR